MFVFSLCFCDCFYGLAQLRALGVPFLMLLLGASQEVTKKDAKTFPLGTPLALPRYKEKQEKDIKFLSASLAT